MDSGTAAVLGIGGAVALAVVAGPSRRAGYAPGMDEKAAEIARLRLAQGDMRQVIAAATALMEERLNGYLYRALETAVVVCGGFSRGRLAPQALSGSKVRSESDFATCRVCFMKATRKARPRSSLGRRQTLNSARAMSQSTLRQAAGSLNSRTNDSPRCCARSAPAS